MQKLGIEGYIYRISTRTKGSRSFQVREIVLAKTQKVQNERSW